VAVLRFAGVVAMAFVLTSIAGAEDAPRKLPVLVEAEPEKSIDGVVKEIKGRIVVLEGGESFSVGDGTKYFQETGLDLAEAKGVQTGDAVLAIGKPGDNGGFVAERVIRLKFVRSGKGGGPDWMEWGSNAVVEGVDKEWILLDQHRKIPIGKQTKIYATKNGKNEPADLATLKKGAMISFNLRGRPVVLKGQEPGDVTTVWVVVWDPASITYATERPRRLPMLVLREPRKSVMGIVKEIKGQVVVLNDGKQFLVSDETKYLKDTGRDPTEIKGVRPGDPVSASGKENGDGALVARHVMVCQYAAVLEAGRGNPSAGDLMQWSTGGVAEGVESGWILLDENRKIPIDKQTKFFATKGGNNESIDVTGISKGDTIDFVLSGRPEVLQGQETGDVTTLWVTVRERR
jgi:hypothetical protein